MKKFCKRCNEKTRFVKSDIDRGETEHLFHVVMLFLTFGLWIIVLSVDAYFDTKRICTKCGKSDEK